MSILFDHKLLKSLRTRQAPLEETDPTRQKQLLETWMRQLEPHWKCVLEEAHVRNPRRFVLKLMLKAEDGYSMSMDGYGGYSVYSEHDCLTLVFVDGVLKVQRSYNELIPIASPDVLIQLKPLALERYLTWKRERLKRQKLLEFKTSAIQNSVRLLAQELQFDYHLSTMRTKLVLQVKLDERTALKVDIPLNRFQLVLSNLKAAITSIRSLHEQGLRFKMLMVYEGQRWTPYVRTGTDPTQLKLSAELADEAEDEADDEADYDND